MCLKIKITKLKENTFVCDCSAKVHELAGLEKTRGYKYGLYVKISDLPFDVYRANIGVTKFYGKSIDEVKSQVEAFCKERGIEFAL